MLDDKLIKDAEFAMTVCNACRYCESICGVFKAIELRREFSEDSLVYLAHLCHDCRGCYYSCQYAPPHEFSLNIPKTFASLRFYTYKKFLPFNKIRGFFDKYHVVANLLIFLAAFVFYFVIALLFNKNGNLFSVFSGAGAFYKVIPKNITIASTIIPFLFALFLYLYSIFKYSNFIDIKNLFNIKTHLKVIRNISVLEFLDGGGDGCNYPDERYSFSRKWFHQFVLYGFILDFMATTIATIKDHLLGVEAPYTIYDLPVLFGVIGGVLLFIGLMGIIFSRLKMDKVPYYEKMNSFDISFITLLLLIIITGFAVLIFRNTSFMAINLILHLSLVFTFFVSLSFNKFYHVIYRYVSIYKYFSETGEK